MFSKVLVANRGEIAVRIIRSVHDLGIAAVAIYSDADRGALHVRMADEAVAVGAAPVSDSYLRVDRVLDAARRTGAQAIHPGYGLLSENADLAAGCADASLTFIGPPASAIRAMGNKTEARACMQDAGVPVVPGGAAASLEQARANASELGYPVMIKAALGGGGKGMRLVTAPEQLASAFERAGSEARAAFGDGTVYLEKALVRPRHVEIQLLADQQGHTVHLFERDCSIQRRHQKVFEETPCPAASAELVSRMGEVAVAAARAVGYCSAGTVEFLLDESGEFYFLEMNTRLQVEHPITEWITGLDLVAEMVRIAAGEPLGYSQNEVRRWGAAVECRIYAEDPRSGFMPSPGTIDALRVPGGAFVRDDSGVYAGTEVSSHYDPLISKLSAWGPDRPTAIRRMRRALGEYVVAGIHTNLSFHERLLQHPDLVAGRYHTGFIEQERAALIEAAAPLPTDRQALAVAMAVTVAARQRHQPNAAERNGNAGLSPWVAAHRARRLG